jgi:hypothetical protein
MCGAGKTPRRRMFRGNLRVTQEGKLTLFNFKERHGALSGSQSPFTAHWHTHSHHTITASWLLDQFFYSSHSFATELQLCYIPTPVTHKPSNTGQEQRIIKLTQQRRYSWYSIVPMFCSPYTRTGLRSLTIPNQVSHLLETRSSGVEAWLLGEGRQAIPRTHPIQWIVVFVILVCKFLFPKATRGFEPISYRGALLSTLLHATVHVFIQFAECTSTDCK